ncbi:hypothetical protein [Streptomyces sp. NPDC101393]|uniref:hypothetical protein n=1 Tax=Streptomyces sp. NPDC101393 TaxID=3366141 RepID=UPI003813FA9C
MGKKQRLVRAGLTVILVAGLGACGAGADAGTGHPDGGAKGSGKTSQDTRPHTDTVSGLRDGVRHVTKKTVTSTRPHLTRTCTTATKRVKHTKRSGRGKKTWYTTERHQDCHKVAKGTEKYRRVVRPERWCVRLDDVNGRTSKDDVWYRVNSATYHAALGKDAHARMTIDPAGTGC